MEDPTQLATTPVEFADSDTPPTGQDVSDDVKTGSRRPSSALLRVSREFSASVVSSALSSVKKLLASSSSSSSSRRASLARNKPDDNTPSQKKQPSPCQPSTALASTAIKWDIFISHKQGNGGSQCQMLFQHLTHAQGVKVWLDMDATDLSVAGMEEGVRASGTVMVFITDGIFEREFCIKEIEWAKQNNKPIVAMYERDERHGGNTVASLMAQIPEHLAYLKNDEWIEFNPRKEYFDACVIQVCSLFHSFL
jgi:hypothetical protein